MHNEIKPCLGRLCRSRAGRDRDEYFIVAGLADSGYVLIADGRLRRLDKPKKKKLKHLRMTPIVVEEAAQRLEHGPKLSDGELQRMLARTGRVKGTED